MTIALKLGNVGLLMLRQNSRNGPWYIQSATYSLSCPLIISGKHNHLNTHFFKETYGLSAGGLFTVRRPQNAN